MDEDIELESIQKELPKVIEMIMALESIDVFKNKSHDFIGIIYYLCFVFKNHSNVNGYEDLRQKMLSCIKRELI